MTGDIIGEVDREVGGRLIVVRGSMGGRRGIIGVRGGIWSRRCQRRYLSPNFETCAYSNVRTPKSVQWSGPCTYTRESLTEDGIEFILQTSQA